MHCGICWDVGFVLQQVTTTRVKNKQKLTPFLASLAIRLHFLERVIWTIPHLTYNPILYYILSTKYTIMKTNEDLPLKIHQMKMMLNAFYDNKSFLCIYFYIFFQVIFNLIPDTFRRRFQTFGSKVLWLQTQSFCSKGNWFPYMPTCLLRKFKLHWLVRLTQVRLYLCKFQYVKVKFEFSYISINLEKLYIN